MLGTGKSDVGKKRPINEDFIFVSNDPIGSLPNLYIVADGMGGHNAGDIASENAIRFFCDHVIANFNTEILDLLVGATRYANQRVFELSKQMSAYAGMGTTFLAACLHEDSLYIAHVGDCRLYLVRDHNIMQITTDHTFVMDLVKAGEITFNEARNHPKRNIITRALGIDDELLVDGLITKTHPGDIFIMCSDGLTTMLGDKEILQLVLTDCELAVKTDALIDGANQNGGSDNISVVLIQR